MMSVIKYRSTEWDLHKYLLVLIHENTQTLENLQMSKKVSYNSNLS